MQLLLKKIIPSDTDNVVFGIDYFNDIFRCGEDGMNEKMFTSKINIEYVTKIYKRIYLMSDDIGNVYIYNDNMNNGYNRNKFKNINDSLYQLLLCTFRIRQSAMIASTYNELIYIIDPEFNIRKLTIKSNHFVMDYNESLLFSNNEYKFEIIQNCGVVYDILLCCV